VNIGNDDNLHKASSVWRTRSRMVGQAGCYLSILTTRRHGYRPCAGVTTMT
jgi:hypothetical protein